MSLRVQEILNFWFGSPDSPEYGKPRKVWFQKDSEFDSAIRSQFLADYEQAAKSDRLPDSPLEALALIITLDQFPRNIFRGTPQAFATDSQALQVAKYAINQEFDKDLLAVQRVFLYLPLEHSENLADQHQSVELFRQIQDDPNSADTLSYAIRHLEVIERFGRFPHRNAILGRETTPEEAEFLQQPGSSF
ncbi:MAG: DUF924 domain-containing protein [Desertifilum sp.]|nr:DUF924 domain-containing protein [Desertifilum sp.]